MLDTTPEGPIPDPKLSGDEFLLLCREQVPISKLIGVEVDYFGYDRVDLRAVFNPDFLRPGGTVSGPIMMTLADAAMYGAVLARLGLIKLAVTTNLSIDFLRKPAPADVIASARLLKLGKSLAVGDVFITSAADGKLVARASATYAIPPSKTTTQE